MELYLKTHGVGQKSGRIDIDGNQISFAGKTLLINELVSISSRSKFAREVLYTTYNAQIQLRTSSDSMVLKLSGSNSMVTSQFEEVLQNFVTIRTAIMEHAGPRILARMIDRLSEGENVQIGKFVFNRKGITTKTILRGELRAGWNEDFEVRPKSKENLLLKYLSASARLMFDHWEIFYHNQAMGKMVNMGEFSFDDDNGCMIPFLISFVKESQTDP